MPADDRTACDYAVMVSRAEERPHAGFWPIALRDRLPIIPVPLRASDPDARPGLQQGLNHVHDTGGYPYSLYEGAPRPANRCRPGADYRPSREPMRLADRFATYATRAESPPPSRSEAPREARGPHLAGSGQVVTGTVLGPCRPQEGRAGGRLRPEQPGELTLLGRLGGLIVEKDWGGGYNERSPEAASTPRLGSV